MNAHGQPINGGPRLHLAPPTPAEQRRRRREIGLQLLGAAIIFVGGVLTGIVGLIVLLLVIR